MFILYRLVKHLKKLLDTHPDEQREEFKITGAGCLLVLLGKMFKLIDRCVIP
jgi:high-affinity nickel-transport protein